MPRKKSKKTFTRKKNNKGNRKVSKPQKRYDAGGAVSPLEQHRRQQKRRQDNQNNKNDLSKAAGPPGDVVVPQDAPSENGWTKEKLSETFNAKNWVGKTDEMKKLWKDVPKDLHDSFDFAAAYSRARRLTLDEKAPPQDFGPDAPKGPKI